MKSIMEEESTSMSTKGVKRVWKSVTNSPRSGVINSFSRRVAFPFHKNQWFLGAQNASIFVLIELF